MSRRSRASSSARWRTSSARAACAGACSVPGRPAVELTRRQSEVLELLRRGLSTAEIAERLQISRVTVRRHLGLAVGRLDAKDRAAALRALDEAEA